MAKKIKDMAKKVTPKSKVKIEVIKPIFGYSYFVGDKFEVDAALAAEWKKAGLVK